MVCGSYELMRPGCEDICASCVEKEDEAGESAGAGGADAAGGVGSARLSELMWYALPLPCGRSLT